MPTEAPSGPGLPVLAGWAWLAGLTALGAYGIGSLLVLRRRLATACLLRDNIWLTEGLGTAFVLGVLRPRIYLPADLSDREQSYILLHEQTHIRYLDHITKALAFGALCIHWFNPLVWLAFVLAGRDLEMRCDEAVIRQLGPEIRADYASSLLKLAYDKPVFAGMPLAFGEGHAKGRIRNLAVWHKPGFWAGLVAGCLCLALAAGLLTNPDLDRSLPAGRSVSDLDPAAIVTRIRDLEQLGSKTLYCNGGDTQVQLTGDLDWAGDQTIRFFCPGIELDHSGQLRLFEDQGRFSVTELQQWPKQERIYLFETYLEALKYLPRERLRQLAPAADLYSIDLMDAGTPHSYDRVVTYSPAGASPIGGWMIHLRVQPLYAAEPGGYSGTEQDVLHLFYHRQAAAPASGPLWFDDYRSSTFQWDGLREIDLEQFPGVTFRWSQEKVEAVRADGTVTPLYSGMPVWSVFFWDLTGDGLPELCSTVSIGSGMIDDRVLVYDYAQGKSYSLADRGKFDHVLRMQDGQLAVERRVHGTEGPAETGWMLLEGEALRFVP